jgi:hypothetical protein
MVASSFASPRSTAPCKMNKAPTSSQSPPMSVSKMMFTGGAAAWQIRGAANGAMVVAADSIRRDSKRMKRFFGETESVGVMGAPRVS